MGQEQRKPTSWLELKIRRQAALEAKLPPSEDVIQEAIAAKRAEIAALQQFRDERWHFEWVTLQMAKNARLN